MCPHHDPLHISLRFHTQQHFYIQISVSITLFLFKYPTHLSLAYYLLANVIIACLGMSFSYCIFSQGLLLFLNHIENISNALK